MGKFWDRGEDQQVGSGNNITMLDNPKKISEAGSQPLSGRLESCEGAVHRGVIRRGIDPERNMADVPELALRPKSLRHRRLVQQAIKGNAEAINKVIDLYYKDILYFAIKKVGRQDGEDVAQQALSQMIDKLETLRDPSKLKSWMMSVVYNSCVDHMRSANVRDRYFNDKFDYETEFEEIEDRDPFSVPEEAFKSAEMRKLISQLIDELPSHYADSLRLHYLDGLSYAEIAEVRGVDIRKVKNDMYRGLILLRKRFEEETDGWFRYGAAPVAALPALSAILADDKAVVVTPDIASSSSLALMGEQAAATTSTTLTVLMSLLQGVSVFKVVGVSAAAILSATAIASGIFFLADGVSEEDALLSPAIESQQIIETAPEPEAEAEADIQTVADMIGADEAALLASYQAGSADAAEWQVFLDHIGAELVDQGVETDHLYRLYCLEKQDKQLVLAQRQAQGIGAVEVIAQFRQKAELPLMLEVILMFP